MILPKDLSKSIKEKMKDNLIFNALENEEIRVKNTYNLIASENLPSKEQLKALGHMINFKYTEGKVGRRFYQGNINTDKIEKECIERAKKLFKCKVANVQPLSGAVMNIALISRILKPNDKILAMSLKDGGHLTHGSEVNFIGKNYNVIPYGVNENGFLDYEEIERMAIKFKPKLIISGATNYSRKINFQKFSRIAQFVKAYHLADISHIAGLCVTGFHQSPIKYADFVTTTTHKTLRSVRSGIILSNKLQYKNLIDNSIFPHFQGGTHPNIIAAKAIGFKEAMKPSFKNYIRKVLENTKYLCEELKKRYFNIVSNGTDNHMFCIDLKNKGMDGRTFAEKLESKGVIVNANTIPGDTGTPWRPKGIRIGLALETTKGITKKQINDIVRIMEEIR